MSIMVISMRKKRKKKKYSTKNNRDAVPLLLVVVVVVVVGHKRVVMSGRVSLVLHLVGVGVGGEGGDHLEGR